MMSFAEVENLIEIQGLALGVSQLHGLLSGYIAAAGDEDPCVWPVRCLGQSVQGGDIQRLFFDIQSGLSSLNFEFQPLLLADNEPLKEQVRSLVRWVEGFMAGLGLSGVSVERFQQGDLREVMADLADLTRLDIEHVQADDASEGHFLELLEYARTLALFVYTEFHFRADAASEAME